MTDRHAEIAARAAASTHKCDLAVHGIVSPHRCSCGALWRVSDAKWWKVESSDIVWLLAERVRLRRILSVLEEELGGYREWMSRHNCQDRIHNLEAVVEAAKELPEAWLAMAKPSDSRSSARFLRVARLVTDLGVALENYEEEVAHE